MPLNAFCIKYFVRFFLQEGKHAERQVKKMVATIRLNVVFTSGSVAFKGCSSGQGG